jgi:sulfopyruvate decarboxylase subunit alpha
MDVHETLHQELKKCGVKIAASLPDDWVAPLINRLDADPEIRHVRVARESEAVMIASGIGLGTDRLC